jgi:hypothetical protein
MQLVEHGKGLCVNFGSTVVCYCCMEEVHGEVAVRTALPDAFNLVTHLVSIVS